VPDITGQSLPTSQGVRSLRVSLTILVSRLDRRSIYSTLAPGNSLTAYAAASSRRALVLALVWWPVGLALATTYFIVISRRYAGKVGVKHVFTGVCDFAWHMIQQLQIVRAAEKDPEEFARIEDAIAAIRAGEIVIVVDDEDRENEGDLTIAAEKITPAAINFMATYGRGLICLAMMPERLDELEIPLMASRNGSRVDTAFCVSIEAKDLWLAN
jgi:hypothetical protein